MKIDKNDIPLNIARRAYSWISMDPDRRANQEQADYMEHMIDVFSSFMAQAKTDAERDYIEASVEKYRQGYIEHKLAQLHAKSRCASTMVTGGSNFNAARNNRANDTERKRSEELCDWSSRAQAAIQKGLREMRVEAAGGPLVIMRQELEAAEREHENLKSIRVAFRKETDPEKRITAMKQITGYEGEALAAFVSRNYIDADGVPVFRLTKGLARIKAMRLRLAEMEKRGDTPTSEKTFPGGRVVDNAEADRIQIFFDKRPDGELYQQLKAHGFRWSPTVGAWQRYRTHGTRLAVNEITGVKL